MSPVNVSSIGTVIRGQREQARISVRRPSQAAGVSNPYLSQIERGLRKPSADILQQIAKGLRISAEALYAQAGILEDRPEGAGIRDAVLADPELTERQKQILIELYESFRNEATPAESATAGAQPPATPAESVPAGAQPPAAGTQPPAAGEQPPAGAQPPAAGEEPPAAGDGEPDRMVPSPAGNR